MALVVSSQTTVRRDHMEPSLERVATFIRGAVFRTGLTAGVAMPSTRLPTTASLRTFESAARHLSCTGAADELCLTQSAISKQLRALEEILGVTLFRRTTQGLSLTPAGGQYLTTARSVLARLELATSEFATSTREEPPLRLQMLQTLGEKWLIPRLMTFVQQNPDVNIQFASAVSTATRPALPDVAFRFGRGDWPEHHVHYLLGKEVVLVCAPRLLADLGDVPLERIFETMRHLEHAHVAEHWADFCQQQGLTMRKSGHPCVRYGYYSLIIESAVAGLGLALVPKCLVISELATGQLKNLVHPGLASRLGYYLVQPKTAPESKLVARFRDWVLVEATAGRPV